MPKRCSRKSHHYHMTDFIQCTQEFGRPAGCALLLLRALKQQFWFETFTVLPFWCRGEAEMRLAIIFFLTETFR